MKTNLLFWKDNLSSCVTKFYGIFKILKLQKPLILLLTFTFLILGEVNGQDSRRSESEIDEPPAPECGCPWTYVDGPTGSLPLSAYQLNIDLDTSICTNMPAFIRFKTPNIAYDSANWETREKCIDSIRHQLSFKYDQSQSVSFEIWNAKNLVPDSIEYLSAILSVDSFFFDWVCLSTTDSFWLEYSYTTYWTEPGAILNSAKCEIEQKVVINCSDTIDLNANTFAIPSLTSCNPITLFTNYSGNGRTHFSWYEDAIAPGNLVSTNPSYVVDNGFAGTIYAVLSDSNRQNCDIGFDTVSWTVNHQGFAQTILVDGTTEIDCSDPNVALYLPTLYLKDSTNYTNHTFQWYEVVNGTPVMLAGETHAALSQINRDGTFYLLTRNTQTNCYDASNYMTIDGFENESYQLTFTGDTAICPFSSINGLLISDPPIPPSLPVGATLDVFYDGISQGDDLSIQGEGYYWLTLFYEGGCRFFSDTLNLDFDTISCGTNFVYNPKSDICTDDPVTLINRSPKSDSIIYTWLMPGGSPSQYTGYYPPLVHYASAGQYTITLIGQSALGSDTSAVSISVSNNCCDHNYNVDTASTFSATLGAADQITYYTGGGIFDGTYHVEGTIVLRNGTYTVNNGSVFYVQPNCEDCDEITNINEDCLVFEDRNRTQIVLDGAVLEIGDAEFRSVCESMWYGIVLANGSEVNTHNNSSGENALIMDAYAGILDCGDKTSPQNEYEIERTSFTNNLFGVIETGWGSNLNLAGKNLYLRNSHIDNDAARMKSPYTGRIGMAGIWWLKFEHMVPYENNFIANVNYGYFHPMIGDPNNYQSIMGNVIRDFQVTAMALGGSAYDVSIISNNRLYFPDQHLGSHASPIADYVNLAGHFNDQKYPNGPFFPTPLHWPIEDQVIGMLVLGQLELENNRFFGNTSRSASEKQVGLYHGVFHPGNPNGDTVVVRNNFENLDMGISAYTNTRITAENTFSNNQTAMAVNGSSVFSGYDFQLLNNTFYRNEVALEINRHDRKLFVKENQFIDNDTAISIHHQNPSRNLDMELNCNKFQLDTSVSYNRYGIFVHQSADMGNIGGNQQQSTNFENPAGNGWPVDPNSPGYNGTPPTTSGDPNNIDVTLWDSPSNWYSVFDFDADPSWRYWRYDNEFVGEHDSAASPSWKVEPPNTVPQTKILNSECPAYLQLVFPQQRVLELKDQAEKDQLRIFPNPAELEVSIEGVEIDNVVSLQMINMKGRVQKPKWNKDADLIQVNINQLENGIWLVLLDDAEGNRKVGKVVINR